MNVVNYAIGLCTIHVKNTTVPEMKIVVPVA
jgi:hypothetical protein